MKSGTYEVVHLGVDVIGVAATLLSGVGAPIGFVLGIDGLINAVCTVKAVANIRDAANKAAAAQCKCPSQ